jgi:hypothetical protein
MPIITDISKILYSIAIILLTLITITLISILLYNMAVFYGAYFWIIVGVILMYIAIE